MELTFEIFALLFAVATVLDSSMQWLGAAGY